MIAPNNDPRYNLNEYAKLTNDMHTIRLPKMRRKELQLRLNAVIAIVEGEASRGEVKWGSLAELVTLARNFKEILK